MKATKLYLAISSLGSPSRCPLVPIQSLTTPSRLIAIQWVHLRALRGSLNVTSCQVDLAMSDYYFDGTVYMQSGVILNGR